MGFDINRIIGSEVKFAKGLECAVCLSILDNPLMTKCGHNYCHQCLQFTIDNGVKSCPKCRKAFNRKRRNGSLDDNSVILRNRQEMYVFTKNLTLNEIIGKLKIKCDYEPNGCQVFVELESLSEHITGCEYRFCKTCGFGLNGRTDDHNCIEVMKNVMNDWEEKCEKAFEQNKKLNENMNELEMKYKKIIEENKILNDKNVCQKKAFEELRLKFKQKVIPNGNPIQESDETIDIETSKMDPQMQDFAIRVIRESKQISEANKARFITKQFEDKYKGIWNCVITSCYQQVIDIHYMDKFVVIRIGKSRF